MSRNEGWQAYVHENGKIQIKKYVEGYLEIEYDSPFVKTYLGELLDTPEKHWSREEAEQYFLDMINKKNREK